jgi:bifunctional DNA-binding transcriptional regulator/antitoxin component of YhaV-PrlF toxin-antitoxin module
MKIMIMTMTLTSKRQAVFPLHWCRQHGLENGGPVNVFDLGKDGLLIRPIKPPGKEVIARLLQQTPVGGQSSKQAESLLNKALHQARE